MAYPVSAKSVIVALFAILARSMCPSSVGVGADRTSGAKKIRLVERIENLILKIFGTEALGKFGV